MIYTSTAIKAEHVTTFPMPEAQSIPNASTNPMKWG